jgi:prevent-host-death family protein
MKKAGIREVRQNLTALISEVQSGREVIITDRGKPVAVLAPPPQMQNTPYLGRQEFRRSLPTLNPPLSQTIVDDREDRIE